MKSIELESHHLQPLDSQGSRARIFVQDRINGDVEIVAAENRSPVFERSMVINPGGPHNMILAVIPKSQRAELAKFLLEA